jgi:glycine betaine/proline transport system substrate-binding protein
MASTELAPVVLGRINESFHQVAAAVVQETLLRLGHSVDVREGPHPEMYPLLGAGALHVFASSWLPGGHGTYWQLIRDRVLQVSPLYDGARFFWAVPDHVPADQVGALPDLARADVTARMATLVVQGTTPGAGLTMRSQQLITDYGLDQAGWTYRIGNLEQVIQTVNERMAAHDWFVTPLWQPQYLNEIHRLRPLDDPRGVFPPPDQAWLTANRAAFERFPERTRTVLQRIHFTLADTTSMDLAVNIDGLDPLAAARSWMDEHVDEVQAWFR